MKKLFLMSIITTAGGASYGQKTILDIEKHASCEVFAQKSDYDWQQRLAQIDSLQGQEITVFEVKGKDNQIKRSYTGKLENPWKKSNKPPTKGQATVITIVVDQNGQKNAYFPLTNDKNYRIYLKSCLVNKENI